MELILVRHAIASPAASDDQDDLRPLTVEGRNKMRRGAKGLCKLAPKIDGIFSSPLIRAMETASIIAKNYPSQKVRELEQLRPHEPTSRLLTWLAKQPASGTIILVGHEPDMGKLLSAALADSDKSFCNVKKGGACCVVFEKQIAAGAAMLRWAMAPAHLRKLGR